MKMRLITRGGTLYLRKRVPKRYASVDPRAFVCLSLHTDSESIANQKAPKIWADLIEAWEAKLAGDTKDAEERFAAARELAAKRGYRWLAAKEVAKLPTDDLMNRVQHVIRSSKPGKPDMIEAAAILGGAKEPEITVSRALELFWGLSEDRILGKSEAQIRKWESPRKRAIANFIEAIGDKRVAEITRDDMLDFKTWWLERIKANGLAPDTGNKDFIHLGNVLRTVNDDKRLGIDLPLSGLSIKGGDKRQRPAFSVKWIKEKLLAPGALDGLNLEARCIFLGMVNTGYRPSEAVGLHSQHIRLDTDIPHIRIEPDGRTLKNQPSRRLIPLTGVSLQAFKQCPDGFPRYRGGEAYSEIINRYLEDNNLRETPQHTMYGLRHSLEDRLLAAETDERIRRDILGHSLGRQRYGKGGSLEHVHRILQAVAI